MPTLLDRLKQRKIGQWTLGYLAAAFVALQVMDGLSEPLGLTQTFQQGLVLLLVLGFALVLVLAWYHGEKGRQRMGGGELLMIVGLLAATGLGLAIIGGGNAPAPEAATLAVLPLDNLSADPDDEYFSDGLTAQIHGQLSRVPGLQVVARTSALRFRGAEQAVGEIGAELGVRYVLGGGVFRDGDRLRISVHLSDATTGFDVWSDEFPGDVTDVLALQAQTAIEIAEALGVRLSEQEVDAVRDRYTDNVAAYDAYLRGWALLESFHSRIDVPEDRLEAARGHFQRAIDLDPDYALALAGLSMVDGYYIFFGADQSPDRLRSAFDLAERALALDPMLPEAHTALAEAYTMDGDFDRAIGKFLEAVNLDPGNAVTLCHLAYACNQREPSDPIAAEEYAREAIRIHPTYFWSYWQLANALERQDRRDEAMAAFEQTVQLNPDFENAHYALGRAHLEGGSYDQALATYERAFERLGTPWSRVGTALAHAGLGDSDESLDALEAALADGFDELMLLEDPILDAVRTSARYQELLEAYR